MKMKELLAGMTAFLLLFAQAGCTEEDFNEIDSSLDELSSSLETEQNKTAPDVDTPVNSDASFVINRSVRQTTAPMGQDSTWTIFVYLCGSDLESEDGMATMDMEEMAQVSTGENIKFVVQTGGANAWNSDVPTDAHGRYVITGGKISLVDTTASNDSMGSPDVLKDFLNWGIQNYSASNMGLVFWNHGSGSINGVCYDEQNEDDSLLLTEINTALYDVYDTMTEPFEFIGFDACLMSTLEYASLLATHAKYMIASEETEPGYGWNYAEIASYLDKNPDADGAELGKVVCDSFYNDCESIGKENNATLSVVDLSKIDSLLTAFNDFSSDLYSMIENKEDFSQIARNITKADNFGGNNRSEGYTNMVDLGGLISACSDVSDSAQTALTAIDDAVIYKRNGVNHENASGLSIYYPLSLQGSEELSIFTDIAPNPYYLGVVDKVAYGAVNSDISNYDNFSIFDIFFNDFSEQAAETTLSADDFSVFDYAEDYAPGSSKIVEFASEPAFDEDGNYSFTLSQESLANTDYVDAAVYYLDEDGTSLFLGFTGDIYTDWETGTFTDNFDGYWFSLPDGQYLSAYLVEECDGYDIYTSPVMVNDEDYYLRFIYDYENQEVYPVDLWTGQDDSGAVGRDGIELKDGDVIVPCYDWYDENFEFDGTYLGDAYTYSADDTFGFEVLPDGDYFYAFDINDIYGNYTMTDPVLFTIDGENIYFESSD